MELLSPAGSLECGIAAFEYGADAVYLGLRQFSARADAENFGWDDLAVLTGIARRCGGRVYVALNTLLRDGELPALAEILARLRDLPVDGLIVQDLAVWRLVRSSFPEMALHASTQMAIHNRAGVEQAKAMGFRRVVAARELTLAEIRGMCVPGIEVEVFCHGALCHAYSGLCQLSSFLRGASGNRGECTYVCRNCFAVSDGEGRRLSEGCALMSMKDLAAGELVHRLREAGVASVKIEGRKKTPLYVAAVTNYYRNLLDGTFAPGEKEEAERQIRCVFSRPWTDLFLRGSHVPGVTDVRTVGPRGVEVGEAAAVVPGEERDRLRFQVRRQALEKHDGLQVELAGRERPFGFGIEEIREFQQGNAEDWQVVFSAPPGRTIEVPLPEGHPRIPPGSRICCASSQAVRRCYSWGSARPALDRWRPPASFQVEIAPDILRVRSRVDLPGGRRLESETAMPPGEPLAPARNPEVARRAAEQAFAKLGDSVFAPAGTEVRNPQGLFVRPAVLNELRRRSAEDLRAGMERESRGAAAKALASFAAPAPAPAGDGVPGGWILKIDRCYYLNVFSPEELSPVREVVFALDRTAPEELPDALGILESRTGSRDRLRLSLSPILREDDGGDWPARIGELYRQGWRKWQVGNPGLLRILTRLDDGRLDWTADWPLPVRNRAAAAAWLSLGCRRVCLSPEEGAEGLAALLAACGGSAETLVYGDVPLAYSAACANASLLGSCPGRRSCGFKEFHLVSRKGERLLALNNSCQTVYCAEEPLDLRSRLPELREAGGRFFRADFLWREHPPVQVHAVCADLLRMAPADH